LSAETKHIQSQLADYCRNGRDVALEGADLQRLKQYRRLVYNIVNDVMLTAYPITYELLSQTQWDQLIEDFFAQHASPEPQLWKFPYELVRYLENAEHVLLLQYPFLYDLICLEWLEIELHTMEDLDVPSHVLEGDWMNSKVCFQPEYTIQHFQYPVQQVKPAEIAAKHKGDYFVLAFREKQEGEVKFIQLSTYLSFILELLIDQHTLSEAIGESLQIFHLSHSPKIEEETIHFLEHLKEQGFIVGFLL
jgi:uncharacterized protein